MIVVEELCFVKFHHLIVINYRFLKKKLNQTYMHLGASDKLLQLRILNYSREARSD